MEIKKIVEMAENEVAEENHRRAVDIAKEHIRLRKSWWVRLFPWRIVITIQRRDIPTTPSIELRGFWERERALQEYIVKQEEQRSKAWEKRLKIYPPHESGGK